MKNRFEKFRDITQRRGEGGLRSGKLRGFRCNICNGVFRARTKLDRFCSTCKQESELFRFAEWLAV